MHDVAKIQFWLTFLAIWQLGRMATGMTDASCGIPLSGESSLGMLESLYGKDLDRRSKEAHGHY